MRHETLWDKDLPPAVGDVVACRDPLMCVLAGPGTLKTTALIRRVARLVEENAEPQRILVVTFTRTAARDLVRQLQDLEHLGVPTVHAGTLHSLCFGMLRQQRVLEATQRVARPLLEYEAGIMLEDLTDQRFRGKTEKWKRLEAFGAGWARLAHERPGWLFDPVDEAFHRELMQWLRFHRAMLIAELVPEALSYLRNNPASSYRGFYRHGLVDEYQDLNNAEQALIDLLAEGATLYVTGDDDQSIYRFKYAHRDGIVNFAEHHDGTHSESLDECWRCPSTVIDLGNTLISRNRRPMPDRRVRPTDGCPDGDVHIVQWQNLKQETENLARFIEWYVKRHDVSPGQVLVLTPRRRIGYRIRDRLNEMGIPAQSHFSEQALEPKAAQDRFTVLTLLADRDDRVALRCWLGRPTPRPAAYRHVWERSTDSGESPWMTMEGVCRGDFAVPGYVEELKARFEALRHELEALDGLDAEDLVEAWLPAGDSDLDELRQIARAVVGEAEGALDPAALREQLRVAITQPEPPIESDSVRIMSLHKSKGLGADLVVVSGCVEGLIPFIEDGLSQREAEEALEEQRRLFYVALTRTKRCVVLSGSRYFPLKEARAMKLLFRPLTGYVVESIASRFLAELGPGAPQALLGPPWLEYVTSR